MQRSGIMRQRAGMRGSTKKSIGGTTMMMNASICWLTFISLPTGCAASRRGPSPPLSGHPSAGRPNAPRPYRGVAAPDVPDASLVAEVRALRLTVLSTPTRRRRYGTHPTVTTSSLISATPSASWDFAVERSLAIVDPQPAVTDLATEHEAGPDHGRRGGDALRLLPEDLRVRLPYLEGVQLRGGIAIELGHGRGAGGRRAGRTGAVATVTRPDLE